MFQKMVERYAQGQGISRDAVLASASLESATAVMKAWDTAPEGTPIKEILARLNQCRNTIRRQTLLKQIAATEDMQEKRKLMEEIHKLNVNSNRDTQSGKR